MSLQGKAVPEAWRNNRAGAVLISVGDGTVGWGAGALPPRFRV